MPNDQPENNPLITEQQKAKILSIVNVFETGSLTGRYDNVVVMADGRKGTRQITYGRSQTTEQGNLHTLIQMYCEACGVFEDRFQPYLPLIGKKPLWKDANFKALLKQAGHEDPIMHEVQDAFFNTVYFQPAYDFFEKNGFKDALSLLVIYDSYIHSGGILMELRKRFNEVTPVKGGDGRIWTESYVRVRHNWLTHHSNPIVRNTGYRTLCFKNQMLQDNWDLSKPVDAHGIVVA